MRPRGLALAVGYGVMLCGCLESGGQAVSEQKQIVDNLLQVGFRADDIMVERGKVYVGRDAEVSLAASREMLQAESSSKEQYRTSNLIRRDLAKICIDGSTFTGAFSTALDLAIQNYDEQPLTFAMARTPSSGCGFTIKAVLEAGLEGGHSGFPAGGLPFDTIFIGTSLNPSNLNLIENVITHEIGHTIGLRHSDYFNRSISCGSGGDEGDAGIGAILIPGTPTGAVAHGSLMNSCFDRTEDGEFTTTDLIALKALYGVANVTFGAPQQWSGSFCPDGAICKVADVNADGNADAIAFSHGINGGQTTVLVALSNGTSFGAPQQWSTSFCPASDTCLVGDVNGDGRADIVDLTLDPNRQVFVSLSTGTSFGARQTWSNFFCLTGEVCALGDVNNDKRADLIAFNHGINGGQTAVFVGLSTGTSFSASQQWSSFFCLANEVCEVADVNGDKQADIVAFTLGANPRAFVSLSTGASFGDSLLWSEFFCLPGEVCRAADVTGDGRADLVAFNHGVNGGTTAVFVGASLGTAFMPPTQASSFFCLANETCEVGDVNRDGRADIVAFTRGASPRAFVGISAPGAQ